MQARLSVTDFAIRARWSRERVIRAIISGRIAGGREPMTGHWMVDASEIERLEEAPRELTSNELPDADGAEVDLAN